MKRDRVKRKTNQIMVRQVRLVGQVVLLSGNDLVDRCLQLMVKHEMQMVIWLGRGDRQRAAHHLRCYRESFRLAAESA